MGKIGRELARYMATLGCSNIIILSRSAADHPNASSLIQELERIGCAVTVRNCDVADEAGLSSVLQACYKSGVPVVKGVVHAAMAVPQDSAFACMTFQQWKSTLQPKVDATWNLHLALPDLEFFVTLSSLVGVGGGTNQANCAAGSTFQDSFARYRCSQGLPTVSISLGAIKDVSPVARNDGAYESISLKQAMRLVESAMLKPKRSDVSSQLISGICTAYSEFDMKSNTTSFLWQRDRRFSSLQRSSSLQQEDNESAAVADRMTSVVMIKDCIGAAKSWDEVIACCVVALASKVSEMFAIPHKEVDVSLPMAYYGVDSLVAVEVRNWLSTTARAELSTQEITQSSSLAALATEVAERSQYRRDSVY